MNEDEGHLVNCPENSADEDHLFKRPLGLICSRSLNQKEQLKIVKLFLKNGANHNSIKEALIVCSKNRDCDLKVIKLLQSHEKEYLSVVTKDISRKDRKEEEFQGIRTLLASAVGLVCAPVIAVLGGKAFFVILFGAM